MSGTGTSLRVPLVTDADKRAYALSAANQIVENLRESNKTHEARTGNRSTVTDADYIAARDRIERSLLRVAGLSWLS